VCVCVCVCVCDLDIPPIEMTLCLDPGLIPFTKDATYHTKLLVCQSNELHRTHIHTMREVRARKTSEERTIMQCANTIPQEERACRISAQMGIYQVPDSH